jgi:hypothetical protein
MDTLEGDVVWPPQIPSLVGLGHVAPADEWINAVAAYQRVPDQLK